ncbi:SDR family NAD(P)-dependent oxidoreductase [Paracoccus nototheniae]|uniref:SDR family NAD(P)-dependent oxidoreductase n=1 Tax=Paracoccus nototheniae TaxID=2489002 RepID=A0ABW4E1E9_9RHOB|nr:SDR family NAD(P)-dependent oxidoreductase [Paracoccus nototheniae]
MSGHILITGGGRGLGLFLCRAASAAGWRVSVTLRDGPAPEGATAYRLDLRDAAAVARLADILGPLDVLINNAGIIGPQASAATPVDPDAFLQVFAINTLAPLLVTQALLPNLRAAQSGRVMSISSQMSWMGYAKSDHIAYRASKAALNKVMQGLATDLASIGLVAVAIDPGWMRTDMGGPQADLDPDRVAGQLIVLASRLGPADSGQFLRADGTPRHW